MHLPNFICVGAQKSGTTYLYDLLSKHSEVFVPKTKELHFFDRDEHFNKGVTWYSEFFSGANDYKMRGDITPSYLFYPKCVERMTSILGTDIKIIILIRHPLDRAYSNYNMLKSRGVILNGFEKELAEETIEVNDPTYIKPQKPRYFISKGLYCKQIKRYLDVFGLNNVLIVRFEDLIKSNDGQALKNICSFLGIKEEKITLANSNKTYVPKNFNQIKRLKKNRSIIDIVQKTLPKNAYIKTRNFLLSKLYDKPDQLSAPSRAKLIKKYFVHDIEDLEKLLGESFQSWKN